MTHTPTRPVTDVLAEATALLGTLRQETCSYKTLLHQFAQQHTAIGQQQPAQLEEVTVAVSEVVHELNQLREQREAHMATLSERLQIDVSENRLVALAEAIGHQPAGKKLGEDLLDARSHLRAQAEVAHQQCDDLLFTVGYAIQMGHERLSLMKGMAANRSSNVYTAKGNATQGQPSRSLLNQVG